MDADEPGIWRRIGSCALIIAYNIFHFVVISTFWFGIILSLLFLTSGVLGFAFGLGGLFASYRWLIIPIIAPLIALLLLFFVLSKYRHWKLLIPILLFLLIHVGYFQIRHLGFRVYHHVNKTSLERVAAELDANPIAVNFFFRPDRVRDLPDQLLDQVKWYKLILATKADAVIKQDNTLFFLLDSFINWHTGVAYSLDGGAPPERGDHYYAVWTTHIEGNWFVYYAAD